MMPGFVVWATFFCRNVASIFESGTSAPFSCTRREGTHVPPKKL
jgi:hypothetical protein